MSISLDILISKDKNAYTMTCAIIKRADQITASGENIEMADKRLGSFAKEISPIIPEYVPQMITNINNNAGPESI